MYRMLRPDSGDIDNVTGLEGKGNFVTVAGCRVVRLIVLFGVFEVSFVRMTQRLSDAQSKKCMWTYSRWQWVGSPSRRHHSSSCRCFTFHRRTQGAMAIFRPLHTSLCCQVHERDTAVMFRLLCH